MRETAALTIVLCVLQAGSKWRYQLTFHDALGRICLPVVSDHADWQSEQAAYAAGSEELSVQLAVRKLQVLA